MVRLARFPVPDEALGLGIPGKTREIEKLPRRGLPLLAELFIDHPTVALAARHVVMDPLIADHPLKGSSLLIAFRFQVFQSEGVALRHAGLEERTQIGLRAHQIARDAPQLRVNDSAGVAQNVKKLLTKI